MGSNPGPGSREALMVPKTPKQGPGAFVRVVPLWMALAMLGSSAEAQAPLDDPGKAGREADVLVQPAKLDVHEVTLETALRELEVATGIPIAYSPSRLPGNRIVSCRCSDTTVEAAVRWLLSGTGMEAVVLVGHLIIREQPVRLDPVQPTGPSSMWAFAATNPRARRSSETIVLASAEWTPGLALGRGKVDVTLSPRL